MVEDSFDRNDEKAAAKPLRVIVEGLSPQAAAVVLSDNGDYIGDVDLPHDASADGGQTPYRPVTALRPEFDGRGKREGSTSTHWQRSTMSTGP